MKPKLHCPPPTDGATATLELRGEPLAAGYGKVWCCNVAETGEVCGEPALIYLPEVELGVPPLLACFVFLVAVSALWRMRG